MRKAFIVCLAFGGMLSVAHAQPDPWFAPAVNYGAGDGPSSVYVADLDGDGDADLAVANDGSFNVSILKNNGDGTYQAGVNYGADERPISVFASDLDGDGDADLAVANYGTFIVSILKNNGDGIFQTPVNYGADVSPVSLFASDLDGDGDADLAVANWASDNISILTNNGNGTYQAALNYAAGNGPWSVFASDLDGDGDADLAVANLGSDNVSILKNNGDGTYQAGVNYGADERPISVFASDLDGDGDADLAVANDGSFNVSILTNNGDGTYQAAVNYGADDGLTSVFAADLDGDSDNDLAVANYWSNNVSILKNNGDGTYQATVNYGAGVRPRSVFAADLDGDGDNDLAVANEFSDNVSILINLSNVGPPELTQYYFIKDRLENLEIDLFPVTIPTAGYDLGAGNSFVDLSIRPGSASGQQLEAFSRLMMAMKLMNAGYRYVPTDTDPLLETEMVRGAEEMWDLGIKNTASAIVSAVGFIHLFDQIGVSVLGEKLYSKMLAKLVGFIVDAAKQVKRFIPSQEVRNWFDLLFPALKEAILNQLREDPCLMCIIVEPGVRLVGDEIAISGYHVPHTQGCISDAGLWASTNNYTGSHEAAEGAFQTCWNSIKVNTDASAQTVAQYEAQSGAPDAIAKTQEFLDSPFSGNPFVVIKKFLGVIGAIVNPAGVYYSVKAAGEAISTAATVPTDIHLGINNIFGQSTFSDLTPNKPEAFGSGVAVAAAVFRQSLPAELEIYNARAAGLAAAVQNGDSAAIFEAAESLYVAAENVSDLFHDQFNAFTSKSDSAWAQVPNFDSLLGRADSASIRANMRLGQSYLVAIGIQLNPYDSEFNAMSMTALDSSAIDLEQSWLVVDSVMQLLSAVTSVPTLVVIPEQDYFMVGRHSAFVVDYVITNIGDDTAIQVFSRASQVEGITIHGADSTPLMDIAPGDSVAMSYSISLDSVPEPSFYYQTSIFDVAAYASNGIGGLASILVTAQTRACGDIDGIAGPGGPVDVADLTYLIAYLFQGGAAPPILAAANVDGINGPGGPVDVADLTYLVAYLFQGGAAPVC